MRKGRVLLVTPVHAKFEAVAALLPANGIVDANTVVDVVVILVFAEAGVTTHIDTRETEGEGGTQLRVVVGGIAGPDAAVDGVGAVKPKVQMVQDA